MKGAMNKITSADCKEAIVREAQANPQAIVAEFVFDSEAERAAFPIQEAFLARNWKRFQKERRPDGSIVRGFDCLPFDDQLRAYVTERDGVIVGVKIQGE